MTQLIRHDSLDWSDLDEGEGHTEWEDDSEDDMDVRDIDEWASGFVANITVGHNFTLVRMSSAKVADMSLYIISAI